MWTSWSCVLLSDPDLSSRAAVSYGNAEWPPIEADCEGRRARSAIRRGKRGEGEGGQTSVLCFLLLGARAAEGTGAEAAGKAGLKVAEMGVRDEGPAAAGVAAQVGEVLGGRCPR